MKSQSFKRRSIALLALVTVSLVACSNSSPAVSGGGGPPSPTGSSSSGGTGAIQGVAVPSSVAVVTATNAN